MPVTTTTANSSTSAIAAIPNTFTQRGAPGIGLRPGGIGSLQAIDVADST
jgi:hypothetical protein